ncbi:hypothetical protein FSP39_023902 [Pinctada imbricata]|uniref:Uncharacterized protein n=1 Tax=Pinctada imbricata TaxID=66713 RepID=A0AA88XU68_PINIB|nr:hypothetical protein FSP39_023902 [Pinctada imbricata]
MKTRQVSSAPIPASPPPSSGSSTPTSCQSLEAIPDEVKKLSEEKSRVIKGKNEEHWRTEIRKQMEDELNARVREALETPPLERAERQRGQQEGHISKDQLSELNSHLLIDLRDRNHVYLKARKWRALHAKRQMQKLMRMSHYTLKPSGNSNIDVIFRDTLSKSNQDEFPGVFGLQNLSEGVRDRNSFEKYPSLKQIHRQFYTKDGYLAALDSGQFPDGTKLQFGENGSYKDRFGVIRDKYGPFWPGDWGPLFPTPRFQYFDEVPPEPLFFHIHSKWFFSDKNIQEDIFT